MNYIINVLLVSNARDVWIFYEFSINSFPSSSIFCVLFSDSEFPLFAYGFNFFYLHVQNPLLRYKLKIASTAIVKQKYRKVEVKL